jgi:DNA-directed RNA polymerase sigma subunit (sigma70/sigma32)
VFSIFHLDTKKAVATVGRDSVVCPALGDSRTLPDASSALATRISTVRLFGRSGARPLGSTIASMGEADDWLRAYAERANSARSLTASEELALIAEARAGDATARDTVLDANRRLVLAVARRAASRVPNLETRVRAGDVALGVALDKFDPSKGFRFSTYATWWIRQAIVGPGSGSAPSSAAPPNWN